MLHQLTSGVYSGEKNLLFAGEKSTDLYNILKKQFKVIKAAGGIVFNEEGKLLLIKRLGKWDLPKGKIESGEDQRLAALREVHEECGLHFLGILEKHANTYHAYQLKGRWILKKTVWYRMAAWGDISVVPQTEEDITEVRWVDEAFVRQKDFDTYDSLKDLFRDIVFPKIQKS